MIGAICFALLSCTVFVYASRSISAYRLGKRWCAFCITNMLQSKLKSSVQEWWQATYMSVTWSPAFWRCSRAGPSELIIARHNICRSRRRRKFATLMLIELAAQWINVAFFILPNAFLLARPCDLSSKLVREASLRVLIYEDASLAEDRTMPYHLDSELRTLSETLPMLTGVSFA